MYLGEEDVASFDGGVSCEEDDEAAGFLVGLPEVLGGEMGFEEVEDCGGLGGGRGCGGGKLGGGGGGG